jgi:hypothetical protein
MDPFLLLWFVVVRSRKVRVLQRWRIGQGPYRTTHGESGGMSLHCLCSLWGVMVCGPILTACHGFIAARGGGTRRPSPAWGHHHRTDLWEHRHRVGPVVRRQGIPLHHCHAREDEPRKGAACSRPLCHTFIPPPPSRPHWHRPPAHNGGRVVIGGRTPGARRGDCADPVDGLF